MNASAIVSQSHFRVHTEDTVLKESEPEREPPGKVRQCLQLHVLRDFKHGTTQAIDKTMDNCKLEQRVVQRNTINAPNVLDI